MSKSTNDDERTEMPGLSYIGVNRYLCTVLEEMRECCKKLNFSPMGSLIEEAQILGNRMEAGLETKGDLRNIMEDLSKLKKARKKLKKEVQALIDERDKLEEKAKKKKK